MTKKGKRRLHLIYIIPCTLMLVLSIIGAWGIAKDNRLSASYTQILNESGIFLEGEDAARPYPQTDIAQKIMEHYNSPLPEGKTNKKALIIGMDGVRADALQNALGAKYSGVTALKEMGGGAYPVFAGGTPEYPQGTFTLPGWTTILTGRWASEANGHSVVSNNSENTKAIEPKTIFTRLYEEQKIDRADFVVNWKGHLYIKAKPLEAEAQYVKEQGYNINWTTVRTDGQNYRAAKKSIEQNSDFIFLVLEYCDDTGHRGGSFGNHSLLYQGAFVWCDLQAKWLIDAVTSRPNYSSEDWLIIITTDHGGHGWSHGKQSVFERTIFAVSNKKMW